MSAIAERVAERYAATSVWLPDLLGAKESVVRKAWTAIKREVKGEQYANPKSAAGGVVYFLLVKAGGKPLGQKLWNLLDTSSGLSADRKWDTIAGQVFSQLRTGNRDLDRVRAAGVAVALLTLSRQRRKADMANNILTKELRSEIEAAAGEDVGKPGAKETPQTVFQEFMTADVRRLAKEVAVQLGGEIDAAGEVVLAVLEDVNDRSGGGAAASIVPSGGEIPENVSVSSISAELEWSIQPSHAFSVALMAAVGQSGVAKRLQRVLIKSSPDFYDPEGL